MDLRCLGLSVSINFIYGEMNSICARILDLKFVPKF